MTRGIVQRNNVRTVAAQDFTRAMHVAVAREASRTRERMNTITAQQFERASKRGRARVRKEKQHGG